MLNETRIVDLIMGAILFGVGLLYLMVQFATVSQLVNAIGQGQIVSNNIYQQANNKNVDYIQDSELYAIILGYREIPIVIDGNEIKADETDYESCFSFVHKGYYAKSYEYNKNHEIIRVIYTYINHF